MEIHAGFSKDGINWDINEERIKFKCDIPEVGQWQYGYDPRVCKLVDEEGKDRYVVTWCNAYGWKPTTCLSTETALCSPARSITNTL